LSTRFLLEPVVLLVFVGVCPAAMGIDATSLAMSGSNLTKVEAEALEEQLKRNPGDLSSRTKLLGYYFSKQFESKSAGEATGKHVLWFIMNSPESEVLATPYAELDPILDPAAYSEGKNAWIEIVKNQPQNLKLLEHSADYFMLHDRALAIESLQRAEALDSENPKWPASLGQIYSLDMITNSSSARTDAAAMALEQFERAYKLSTEAARDGLLGDLAKAALEANEYAVARSYAERMITHNPLGWNYGNNIHHANIILGRLALRMDDFEEAKKRLIKAGATPGSPQLDSFGPNMTLAEELLQKGERDVVLEYLELCSNFWEMGLDRLDEWSVLVQGGRIPDFGTNLHY